MEPTLNRHMPWQRGVAAQAPLAVRLAKEAVNKAFELGLYARVGAQRRLFQMLFSLRRPKGRRDRLHRETQTTMDGSMNMGTHPPLPVASARLPGLSLSVGGFLPRLRLPSLAGPLLLAPVAWWSKAPWQFACTTLPR